MTKVFMLNKATQTATGLRRQKREWILPPTKLKENVDYTKQEYISKIRSDKDIKMKPFEYILRGHGADKEPYNLFVVNPQNGYVRITGILDRESVSQYNLTGIAKYKDGNLAEEEIQLKIQVEDENDNPPKFKILKGAVRECSKIGTPVMQIIAEDADEQGSINAKIAYSIVNQIPEESGNMFTIDRDTGKVYVKKHTLDREVYDSYTLIVQGVDMDGAPHGNTGTGTVEIKVLDINDNVPTLEKEEYVGAVDEGAVDVVVMRIKAMDKDLEKTDNWLAVFDIVKGNEDEIFTIETDPLTNEGILKLVKPVDYEKVKTLDIDLAISNVAPFINGTALSMGLSLNVDGFQGLGIVGGAGAGVDLDVDLDVDGDVEAGLGLGIGGSVNTETDAEAGVGVGVGVGVKPGVKPGSKPESKPDTDSSTKPGTKPNKKPSPGGKSYPIKINVNNLPEGPGFSPPVKELPVSEDPKEIKVPMVIGSFPALDIDTGEIAENVRQTATGTIALKVQDSNDHCPILTSTYQSICSDNKVVNVTAFDEDNYPNAEPYKFVLLEEETRGKWEMVLVNETTVSFHAKEPLWQGFYELSLEIFDKQGLGCKDKQKLQLEVCTCEGSSTCDLNLAQQRDSSAKLGLSAISALITALVLLLLIPLLLLFCQCGTFGEFSDLPFDTKEYLIEYNTEGKGEDKMVPLMLPPVGAEHQTTLCSTSNHAAVVQSAHAFDTRVFNKELNRGSMDVDSTYGYHLQTQNTLMSTQRNIHHSASFKKKVLNIYEEIALPNDYLHGYFTQKASFLADLALSDSLLVYNDEGQYSLDATDLDTILEVDNDLSFLNDLDMKFFNLATLCSPQTAKSEQLEQIVTSEKTSTKSESSVGSNAVQVVESDQSSLKQNTSMNVNETINYQSTNTSKVSEAVNELASVNASSTLVMQQQPLYCLVEHQTPSAVIVAEQPVQGMYLINGLTGAQGLILQGGNTLQDAVATTRNVPD
ncbi:Desmoglein-2 [Bagarius yarrelli]|uniref:Desmoglein-2 n=1 Tax=Bagarius yarrelli TaxID=175774 RepID=A0A556TSW1_BAGYA|nr:Desmoglein-2 [Bagarius yarrelli]